MSYILSYDISDDKRRQQVNKLIKKSGGIRMQYSVYLLKIRRSVLQQLLNQLKGYVEINQSESIYVLSSNQSCLPLHVDNKKLLFYLSAEAEEIYL